MKAARSIASAAAALGAPEVVDELLTWVCGVCGADFPAREKCGCATLDPSTFFVGQVANSDKEAVASGGGGA